MSSENSDWLLGPGNNDTHSAYSNTMYYHYIRHHYKLIFKITNQLFKI